MQANISRLATLARECKANIIHARSRAPAWSSLAASRRVGSHFLTTVQGIHGVGTAIKRRYNSVMTMGELVITNSSFTAEHIKSVYGADPSRIRVVHRGVDLSLFSPEAVTNARMVSLAERWRLPDGVPIIMLPGRLTRWKGHELLIDSIAKLKREDICCIFVGEGKEHDSYRRSLERKINRLNLGKVVRLVGGCNDMPAAYMLADVIVSASYRPEAFGRVLAEAEALGRPVVAANHGGARETVIDGETGWLFEPEDSSDLARKLMKALTLSDEDRIALAQRSMSHIKNNFSLEKMCMATLNVYSELLEGDNNNFTSSFGGP